MQQPGAGDESSPRRRWPDGTAVGRAGKLGGLGVSWAQWQSAERPNSKGTEKVGTFGATGSLQQSVSRLSRLLEVTLVTQVVWFLGWLKVSPLQLNYAGESILGNGIHPPISSWVCNPTEEDDWPPHLWTENFEGPIFTKLLLYESAISQVGGSDPCRTWRLEGFDPSNPGIEPADWRNSQGVGATLRAPEPEFRGKSSQRPGPQGLGLPEVLELSAPQWEPTHWRNPGRTGWSREFARTHAERQSDDWRDPGRTGGAEVPGHPGPMVQPLQWRPSARAGEAAPPGQAGPCEKPPEWANSQGTGAATKIATTLPGQQPAEWRNSPRVWKSQAVETSFPRTKSADRPHSSWNRAAEASPMAESLSKPLGGSISAQLNQPLNEVKMAAPGCESPGWRPSARAGQHAAPANLGPGAQSIRGRIDSGELDPTEKIAKLQCRLQLPLGRVARTPSATPAAAGFES